MTALAALGAALVAQPSHRPLVVPAHTTGAAHAVVEYGRPDAPHTVNVRVDLQHPGDAVRYGALVSTVRALADHGDTKIDYHVTATTDTGDGASGSTRALAALGAAAAEGPDEFAGYLAALASAREPAKESEDSYGSTASLLTLADTVPGLRTPAFTQAVKEHTYLPWAATVGHRAQHGGQDDSPVLDIDGHSIEVPTSAGHAYVESAPR